MIDTTEFTELMKISEIAPNNHREALTMPDICAMFKKKSEKYLLEIYFLNLIPAFPHQSG